MGRGTLQHTANPVQAMQLCRGVGACRPEHNTQPTLLPLLKVSGGRPSAKCSTTALISCLPVHSWRGRSMAGGGSVRWIASALPAAQDKITRAATHVSLCLLVAVGVGQAKPG